MLEYTPERKEEEEEEEEEEKQVVRKEEKKVEEKGETKEKGKHGNTNGRSAKENSRQLWKKCLTNYINAEN